MIRNRSDAQVFFFYFFSGVENEAGIFRLGRGRGLISSFCFSASRIRRVTRLSVTDCCAAFETGFESLITKRCKVTLMRPEETATGRARVNK
jgi:hypothetical protein